MGVETVVSAGKDGYQDNESGKGDLSQDALDMHRLGNTQELKRNFHSLAVLGLTCIIITTWTSILSASTISLIDGGKGGTIWTFIVTWLLTVPVVASLAEMASMAPTAGGQYHWVSEFSPPKVQAFLSYVSGWLSALGWQTFVAGAAFGTAVMILGMANLGNPEYEPTKWQITLMTIAVGFCAVMFNIFGAKRLPLFEGVILFLYILGFFVVILPIWILAPKPAAHEVFFDFKNFGGWSTIGTSVLIGQTAAFVSLLGADSAAHMSEEIKDASRSVPRMMLLTLGVNGALGLVMAITYCFAIQDIEAQILGATSPLPYIQVFAKATTPHIAIGMMIPVTIMSFSACINAVMAGSRQTWSFARDDGLPAWFAKLYTIDSTPMPLNAMFGSLIILVVIALLNLGGSEVIQSLIGLSGAVNGITYSLSIGAVLWRRLYGAPLPPSKFSLGRFAVPINAFAAVYQLFCTVISFFPLFVHVSATAMNWSIAVFGGVAVIGAVNYLIVGRKKYRGPVVRIVKEQ